MSYHRPMNATPIPELQGVASIAAPRAKESAYADPYSVVSEMLEYFDRYHLATFAPIASIIERERLLGEERGRIAERARCAAIADQQVRDVGCSEDDWAWGGNERAKLIATTIRKDTSHGE